MNGGDDQPAPASVGFFRQFLHLALPYWSDGDRWAARGWMALLILLTAMTIVLAIRLNTWNADLFDALESRSMDDFLDQVGIFALILAANTVTVTAHLHVKRRIQIDWRRWLTQRLMNEWMEHGRHYQIGLLPGDHSNPDGRISEDIRNAAETAIDLGHSLFYCILLLGSFVGILWSLSGTLPLPLGAMTFDLPGHMVWLALIYSGIGSAMAFAMGRPLVRATDTRQTMEADFRFSLVQARESSEAIALLGGEPSERRRLAILFDGIRSIWNLQTVSLVRLMAFSSGYNMLWTMLPILVTTPRYLAGTITLGTLMQTAQAFQQVTGALSWPVDNFPKIAEWRASVERVLALHNILQDVREDVAHPSAKPLRIEPVNGPTLAFRDLSIANPDGSVLFTGIDAEIRPGDRVLISGDSRAAHTLFKVVAGVWPWGRGRVELPEKTIIQFVPERPYLLQAPLRRVLTYPQDPESFDDNTLAIALQKVGLPSLARRLDDTERWDQMLSVPDQQRLGFARLFLQRPDWVFLQEATDALEPADEAALMQLLVTELPKATVLTIGHHPVLEAFHQRKLTLDRATDGAIIMHEIASRRVAEQAARVGSGRGRRLFEWLRGGLGHGA